VYKLTASTVIVHSIIWEGSQAELKPDLQFPPEKSIMMECMVWIPILPTGELFRIERSHSHYSLPLIVCTLEAGFAMATYSLHLFSCSLVSNSTTVRYRLADNPHTQELLPYTNFLEANCSSHPLKQKVLEITRDY